MTKDKIILNIKSTFKRDKIFKNECFDFNKLSNLDSNELFVWDFIVFTYVFKL